MKKNVRFTQNGIYLEGSQSEKEGKEIPLVSKNTGEGYIEQLMNARNECGGFYLEIKEVGDEYKPEELINVKNSYDGAVYTPNTAATILKIPIM